MLDRRFVDTAVAQAALTGLLATRKTLPPALFYDAEGCRLFGRITELPEYYLTRTERSVLTRIAPALAALAPPGAALVEYGASDEGKARLLLDAEGASFAAYVPIDVAGEALEALACRMRSHPAIAVHPVAADFLLPVRLPAAVRGLPKLGFFPGSTIGNLDPAAARLFLARVRETLHEGGGEAGGEPGGKGGRFIVGADLRKDPSLLLPAYDDAAGVTAAFNVNLLARLNREAGADFDLENFKHRAVWNELEGRIEMHLVSRGAQNVLVAGRVVRFAAGETIHTENSYKHSEAGFAALAQAAGWRVTETWTDGAGLFGVFALD